MQIEAIMGEAIKDKRDIKSLKMLQNYKEKKKKNKLTPISELKLTGWPLALDSPVI